MTYMEGKMSVRLDASMSEYEEMQERIKQLETELAEARKVIGVVDGLVTAKGRYHTAQWYQKMVTALDEYKAAIKE